MKTRISSKYGLDTSPRLVDIIAAVPAEAKKILLPKLKAKPIRTASGVGIVVVNSWNEVHETTKVWGNKKYFVYWELAVDSKLFIQNHHNYTKFNLCTCHSLLFIKRRVNLFVFFVYLIHKSSVYQHFSCWFLLHCMNLPWTNHWQTYWIFSIFMFDSLDCCGCCHVQASPLSPH